MKTMRITAPSAWLDDVDVDALRQWFLDHGFRTLSIEHCTLKDVLVDGGTGMNLNVIEFPTDIKRLSDWRHRVLEIIELAAELHGITAAEWFDQARRKT